MGIQLVYGNYFHAINEAEVKTDVSIDFNPARIAYSRVVRWMIDGVLIGSGPAELAFQQAALVAAYDTHYLNATLIDTSTGGALMTLSNAGSITGVRVIKPPSFPTGRGAEFATKRTYSIVLEAEYEYTGSPEIVEWKETVKMWGGGPKLVWVEVVEGPAQLQQLKQQQTYKALQTGTAVGRLTKPTPPAPIWPGALMEKPERTIESAERIGYSLRNSRVSWSYMFESSAPLLGLPNEWPLI